MSNTKTKSRAVYVQACYKSGSLESYIEQRLKKLNDNPIKTTKYEKA